MNQYSSMFLKVFEAGRLAVWFLHSFSVLPGVSEFNIIVILKLKAGFFGMLASNVEGRHART